MNKKTTIFVITALSVICLLAIAGTVISTFAYLGTGSARAEISSVKEDIASVRADVADAVKEKEEEPEQENDVCIAGEYYIRDTSAISDAYKSGDSSALDDRQKETLKMASDILDEIIEDGMTPYEKEKAVYEWLTLKLHSDTGMLTVIPTSSADSDNPYGVLKYRSAVCVGYATTFRMFMHMMDIDCMVVHDTMRGHSWDLIKLDNEWYHTDCYFDSDEGSYRLFNVSDSVLGMDHDWNRDFFPKATGTKYNYAINNAVELDDIYAIPGFAKQAVDNGEKCFSCRIKGGIAPEDEPAAAYMSETVSSAINNIYNGYLQYYWTKDGNDEYVLSMFFDSYNGSDDPVNLPEETLEKINESIEDVFGDYGGFYYNDYDDFSGTDIIGG